MDQRKNTKEKGNVPLHCHNCCSKGSDPGIRHWWDCSGRNWEPVHQFRCCSTCWFGYWGIAICAPSAWVAWFGDCHGRSYVLVVGLATWAALTGLVVRSRKSISAKEGDGEDEGGGELHLDFWMREEWVLFLVRISEEWVYCLDIWWELELLGWVVLCLDERGHQGKGVHFILFLTLFEERD